MTCKSACISCVRINHATIVNVVVYHTGRHKRSSEVKVHMLEWSVWGAICVQYPGNDLARILPCATAGILEGSRAMFCTPFGSPVFCITTGTLLHASAAGYAKRRQTMSTLAAMPGTGGLGLHIALTRVGCGAPGGLVISSRVTVSGLFGTPMCAIAFLVSSHDSRKALARRSHISPVYTSLPAPVPGLFGPSSECLRQSMWLHLKQPNEATMASKMLGDVSSSVVFWLQAESIH